MFSEFGSEALILVSYNVTVTLSLQYNCLKSKIRKSMHN